MGIFQWPSIHRIDQQHQFDWWRCDVNNEQKFSIFLSVCFFCFCFSALWSKLPCMNVFFSFTIFCLMEKCEFSSYDSKCSIMKIIQLILTKKDCFLRYKQDSVHWQQKKNNRPELVEKNYIRWIRKFKCLLTRNKLSATLFIWKWSELLFSCFFYSLRFFFLSDSFCFFLFINENRKKSVYHNSIRDDDRDELEKKDNKLEKSLLHCHNLLWDIYWCYNIKKIFNTYNTSLITNHFNNSNTHITTYTKTNQKTNWAQ